MTSNYNGRDNDSGHHLFQVLCSPVISEKSTQLAEKHNQVIFKIAPSATKQQVKAAVEMLFKVIVKSVQVLNQKGKVKRFGRMKGRRKNMRKAYICLAPGQEINFEAVQGRVGL